MTNPQWQDHERERRFWRERVDKYESELRQLNAGLAKRERAEIEADLARCSKKLREAGYG